MKPSNVTQTSSVNNNSPIDKVKDGKAKKDAFSKVMQRKGEAQTTELNAPPASAFQPVAMPGLRTNESQEATPAASVSRDVEGLAGEISNSLQGGSLTSEVNIQFDSQTLGSLQVRLSKQNGKLAVELTSKSVEISKLLAQNAETLAHRLENKGYVGATIQVRTSNSSSNRNDRGPGGDQQQRQGGQQPGQQERRR